MMKISKSFYKVILCYELDDLDINPDQNIANKEQNKWSKKIIQCSINKYKFLVFQKDNFREYNTYT